VNAQNAAGTGPYSPIDSATTLTPPPGPPVTWVSKSTGSSSIWNEIVSNNAGIWLGTRPLPFTTNNILQTLDNGETYSELVPIAPSSSLQILSRAITFVPPANRFVILSTFQNNAFYTTDNGANWTQSIGSLGSGSAFWQSVCFGNGTIVGVRSNGGSGFNHYVISIDNGTNFSQISSLNSTTLGLQSVCYGEPVISSVITPRFVAVGTTGSFEQYVTYSDLTANTWTAVTISTIAPNINWTAVCFGNGLYVAVGFEVSTTNGYVMSSADGATWTTPVITFSGTPLTWSSVNFGNGYFVAVSNDTTTVTTQQIMYSTDGVNWTLANSPAIRAWNHVAFSSGTNRWIAIDADLAMVCDV